jgi:uncharacterized protein
MTSHSRLNRYALPLALVVATACGAATTRRADGGATAGATTPIVLGETFTMESAALGERRRINVYLPPGYAADTMRRAPVLYMPDGGMAEDFPHVAGLIHVLVGNGTMRPFILVGIENTERRRDMTGPTTVEADRRIAPRVGGSAAFRAFIRSELIPRIRTQYRTTAETGIVGESLAGLFVVETFLTEPAMFDHYLAFDPTLRWNGGALVRGAGERLRTLPVSGRTLYLASSGDAGLEPAMAALTADLGRAPGVRWTYTPMPEETHATIYHPAAMRAFREVFRPAPTK